MARSWWLALVLAGCAADGAPLGSESQPIIGGTFQPGDPAVVAFVDGVGQLFCTGSLVSPHVVLTAAHCLTGGPPSEVFFGSDPAAGGTFVQVASATYHPEVGPNLENDVGVVILAEPAPADVKPLPMARRAPRLHAAARFVGFGCQDTGLPPCPDEAFGRKFQVSAGITEVHAENFRYGVATCIGDSGGPAFVDEFGREVVAGLTSFGDTPCEEFGVDTRVDAFRDWVIDFITLHDPDFVLDDPPLPEEDDGGCGCRAGRGQAASWAPLVLLVLFRRRRRG